MTIIENLSAAESLAALRTAKEGCGGASCQNGGQCRNGECVCRDGFEGQFCESKEEGVAAELIWFLIIGIILVLAVLLYFNTNALKMRLMARADVDVEAR